VVSELTVVSPGFRAALVVVALLWWVAAWQLRGRRVLVGAALVPLALFWSLVAAADMVNAHYGYLPHAGDVRDVVVGGGAYTRLPHTDLKPVNYQVTVKRHPSGGVIRLAIPDRGSGFGPSSALVYLPPQYFSEPDRRFAVVYLVHGSPGSPADWFRGGNAALAGANVARAGRPVVLVVPRMSRGWTDDPECLDGRREHIESHLLADVVPTVDADLRTVPSTGYRAIGGMSAGGYCALNLGLRHPGTFGAILDLSGLTYPTHTGGLSSLLGTGPAARLAAYDNSPADYAARLRATGPEPAVWLDAGRSDREVVRAETTIRTVLAADGFDVRLRLRPGGHTFAVWRPALVDSLTWYTSSIPR
jgi:enterochelin esterase-like enzyme